MIIGISPISDLILSIKSKPFMSGKPRSKTTQSVFVVQFGQSVFGGANCNRFHVAVADQFHNALLSDLVVFYDQQALHAPPDKSVKPGESFAYSFGRDGLVFIAHGAHLEAALPFIVDGEDVHRNVPRVSSMLQA